MKRKKIDLQRVPWTPFERAVLVSGDQALADALHAAEGPGTLYKNSRYQVMAREIGHLDPPLVHLSIHSLDRSAVHDWRDFQRIKNELVGPEYEAIELYPAESRLVDSSNEFHLWCVKDPAFRFPVGWNRRFVGFGNWRRSRQREWPAGERPADAISPEAFEAEVQRLRDAIDECPRCHNRRPLGPWNGEGGFERLCAECKAEIALATLPKAGGAR